MQTPICQPATEPTQDPAGGSIKHTAHLYVFIPMFSVDNDQNPNDECWATCLLVVSLSGSPLL
jgi:hypothetical protein